MLGIFIILDAKRSGRQSDVHIAYFLKKKDIQLPKQICDDRNYSDNWVSEIFHTYKEKKMSVISLANELFLIETHNRNLAKIDLLNRQLKTFKRKR